MRRNYLIIIFLGFIARNLISIINFVLPYLGGSNDSFRFHNCAGIAAGYELTSEYWKRMCPYFHVDNVFEAFFSEKLLSSIYLIFGHHVLIGNLFSCVVWLISAFLLLKILIKLNITSKYISYSLIFYSFVPSGIFYTSVILREPMQLLAINLSMLLLVYFFHERKIKYLILLLFSFFLLASMHRALIVYVLFLVFLFFIYLLIKSRLLSWIILIPVMIVFYYIGTQVFLLFEVKQYFGEGFYKGLTSYLYHASISAGDTGGVYRISRSQYVIGSPDIKNAFDFVVLFIPKSFLQYFLEPIPFIRTLISKDFYFSIENAIRFILLCLCFKRFFSTPKDTKLVFFIIFLAYLFIETMWAVGTVNWGTASRHHIVSYGLLAIVAFYVPKKMPKLNKKIR